MHAAQMYMGKYIETNTAKTFKPEPADLERLKAVRQPSPAQNDAHPRRQAAAGSSEFLQNPFKPCEA